MTLTPEQFDNVKHLLANQRWRLENLYHITNKNGQIQRFRLNWAQKELHEQAHLRNNILKVRQLGISTYMSILMLDSCLFTKNFNAAIVDRTLPDAEEKMAKIRFAFDHLDHEAPNADTRERDLAALGKMVKKWHTDGCTIGAKKAHFRNGSQIRIGTTIRGGTLQLLHVSELGSIARADPIRAREIITGTGEAVGSDCRIYMESTHEGGKVGVNYEQIMSAMANIGHELTPLDSKFFFFPWYRHPDYRLVPATTRHTTQNEEYFERLETELNITLNAEQREWYAAKKRSLGAFIRQEYPSTPEEALNPILEGSIFEHNIMDLLTRGHLNAIYQHDPHRPIYTTWDLGINDYMSIWWLQPDGHGHWLVLDNYTANRLPIEHYIDILKEKDARFQRCTACVIPHDGTRNDIHLDTYDAALRRAGYRTINIPRTSNKWLSIENTRELLRTCIFHTRCSEPTIAIGTTYPSGVESLKQYRLRPGGAHGTESREPLHDIYSHAADALRTFADAVQRGLIAAETGWVWGSQPDKKRRASNYVASRQQF